MKPLISLLLIFLSIETFSQELRFFEFTMHGDHPDSLNMIAATSREDVISEVESQLALPEAERNLHINGVIAAGTGTNNPEYSWHFVTNEWALAEISFEVCDGSPYQMVEQDTSYWLNTVGRFCPWNSYVKAEIYPSSAKSDTEQKDIKISVNLSEKLIRIENRSDIHIQLIRIYNNSGQVVDILSGPFANTFLINFQNKPSGIYYVLFKTEDEPIVKKVFLP